MPEQFDVAAVRHFQTAEYLELGGYSDDAGYHYGVSAENAVKSAMREAGLEQHWIGAGSKKLQASPMRGHWGQLQQRISAAEIEINLYASGRRASALARLALKAHDGIFDSWHIDIRYADPDYVPVTNTALSEWKYNATEFIVLFVT